MITSDHVGTLRKTRPEPDMLASDDHVGTLRKTRRRRSTLMIRQCTSEMSIIIKCYDKHLRQNVMHPSMCIRSENV
jgi:hypothetical protein